MFLSNIFKKVPVYNKEELLLYILENTIDIILDITTNSGRTFKGYVISISEVVNQGTIVLFQIIENNKASGSVLQINTENIESIVFANTEGVDIINVLSKGAIEKPKEYTSSSKLDVKRRFKKFTEVILEQTGVQLEVSQMDLPDDAKQLNRIYQITEQIQKLIISVLSEQDAKESWVSKFTEVKFVEHEFLKVISNDSILAIYFPYTNLMAPEINKANFNSLVIKVL